MPSMNKRSGVDRDLEDVFRDLADLSPVNGTRLLLYREHPGARLRYVSTFTAESFDLKQIQKRFGGGGYWLLAKRNGRLIKKRRFEIEGVHILRSGNKGTSGSAGSALAGLIDNLPAQLRVIREQLESLEAGQQELRHRIACLAHKTRREPMR